METELRTETQPTGAFITLKCVVVSDVSEFNRSDNILSQTPYQYRFGQECEEHQCFSFTQDQISQEYFVEESRGGGGYGEQGSAIDIMAQEKGSTQQLNTESSTEGGVVDIFVL